MKEQISSIGSTTSVHETTESRIKSRIGTEGKSNVRQAIINGDKHGCKRWTGPKSVHREQLDNLHPIAINAHIHAIQSVTVL